MSGGICSPEFENKVMARIRESVGELITEDELKQIVSEGIRKLFFDPRIEHDGWRKIEHPPLIVHVVKELLREEVEKAVETFVKENSEEIIAKVRDVVQEGIGEALIQALNSRFYYEISTFQQNIESRLMSSGLGG